MESETSVSPAEPYEKRIAFFSEQAKTFNARSRRYSNLRLAIVLLGAASVFVIPKNNAFGVGILAGFLVLLVILFAVGQAHRSCLRWICFALPLDLQFARRALAPALILNGRRDH